MSQIKKLFSITLRGFLSFVVFLLIFLIWTFLTNGDNSVLFKIFVALFVAGIFAFVRWALN